MDIKSEFEIKEEEFNFDSYQQNIEKGNEKCSEEQFESEEGKFFAKLVASEFPLVLLKKLSEKEIQTKEEQKREFVKKDIEEAKHSRVLNCFSDPTYQQYFIKVEKILWRFFPKSDYATLLARITDRFTNKGHDNYYTERRENDYDYYKLFKDFWSRSSDEFKRYIFSDEKKHVTLKDLLLKLFETGRLTSSIDEKNVEIIKLILNDATPKEKESIISFSEWGALCNKLIMEEKWELLEEVIEKCTSSEEQINQFKKGFFLCWDAFSYLVRHDKLSLLDEVEKWSTRSKEESKEYKRKMFFSQCGTGECFVFIMKDEVEFADKFVRWSFSSEEEIKEFKKEFVSNFGHIICKNLIAKSKIEDIYDEKGYYTIGRRINFQGGKWEQVEMFLTWCFSYEEEISEFKQKRLLEVSGKEIHFNLIKANQWGEAETFFAWLGLSEKEIKKLKKETLLNYDVASEMFSKLMYNEEGYEEFLDYGSKREAIELFLRWYFTDKETILEYQDYFKQCYGDGEITEKEKVVLKDFDLAIEQCLNDLEQKKRKAFEDSDKDENPWLPSKKFCNIEVGKQGCRKQL